MNYIFIRYTFIKMEKKQKKKIKSRQSFEEAKTGPKKKDTERKDGSPILTFKKAKNKTYNNSLSSSNASTPALPQQLHQPRGTS